MYKSKYLKHLKYWYIEAYLTNLFFLSQNFISYCIFPMISPVGQIIKMEQVVLNLGMSPF